MLFEADFETTTYLDDNGRTRVWVWGLCEIGNEAFFKYGTTLDEFFEFCWEFENHTIYFHNEKFDGTFIMVWLFEHGYTHITDSRELQDKQFSTLISDTGLMYNITVMHHKDKNRHKTQKVIIYDSYKIIPLSVKDIAKGFGLALKKGSIDYDKYRPPGYYPDNDEIDYLRNDVQIVSIALNTLFKQGLTRMTQGSNALFDYKRTITKKKFDMVFPEPDYDKDIRHSYKGGFTYLVPYYADMDISDGIVLDVNSLYPYVMRYKLLPYGDGVFYNGEYEKDELYPLYVQRLICNFELKEKHLPTIQIKKSYFSDKEYLTSSEGHDVALTLTSVDLELFLEHYNVYNIEYLDGWKFKSSDKLFIEYIDHWSKVKISAKKAKNKAQYMLAKLMLNALYGKFATQPEVRSKIPYYDEGVIRYRTGAKEHRKAVYIPVGTFITSWARYITITSAQKVYDRFMYADTDSLHLRGTELPACLNIDDTELGAWKHESTFRKARYLKAKSYIEDTEIDEKEYLKLLEDDAPNIYKDGDSYYQLKVTCAGLPERCHKHVTWDNFHPGAEYPDKLKQKNVPGGMLLIPSPHKIS